MKSLNITLVVILVVIFFMRKSMYSQVKKMNVQLAVSNELPSIAQPQDVNTSDLVETQVDELKLVRVREEIEGMTESHKKLMGHDEFLRSSIKLLELMATLSTAEFDQLVSTINWDVNLKGEEATAQFRLMELAAELNPEKTYSLLADDMPKDLNFLKLHCMTHQLKKDPAVAERWYKESKGSIKRGFKELLVHHYIESDPEKALQIYESGEIKETYSVVSQMIRFNLITPSMKSGLLQALEQNDSSKARQYLRTSLLKIDE